MKKVAVIMPTPWDRDQLERAEVRAAYDVRVFGDALFSDLTSLATAQFDVEQFIEDTASAAAAWGAAGVIGTLDYPASLVAAAVCERLRLPSPSLHALLSLAHKYYARLMQREVAPNAVPPFFLLNPSALALPPRYPLFVKPVKGTLSALAREVDSAEALQRFLSFTPVEAHVFAAAMRPMNALLALDGSFPIDAEHFIAEGVEQGELVTVEGFVHQGAMQRLGIVDSVFYPGTRSFERFAYPSRWPVAVQARMWALAQDVMLRAGFDDGVFDLELIYDEARDRIAIIEVNPRICPQFSDLYEKVDGRNSYDVLLALATAGAIPEARGGAYACAASCVLRTFENAIARNVPSAAALRARLPHARVVLLCHEGEPLSAQLQDVASYRYCVVNLGGESAADIAQKLEHARASLGIELEPL